MTKLFNLFLFPALCGSVIVLALHTLIPHPYLSELQLTNNSLNFTFGYLGFGFGFLPVFIRNYAIISMLKMRAKYQEQNISVPVVVEPLPLFVGQTFTSNGANCVLRVKSVNVWAVLEYNNELLADYL